MKSLAEENRRTAEAEATARQHADRIAADAAAACQAHSAAVESVLRPLAEMASAAAAARRTSDARLEFMVRELEAARASASASAAAAAAVAAAMAASAATALQSNDPTRPPSARSDDSNRASPTGASDARAEVRRRRRRTSDAGSGDTDQVRSAEEVRNEPIPAAAIFAAAIPALDIATAAADAQRDAELAAADRARRAAEERRLWDEGERNRAAAEEKARHVQERVDTVGDRSSIRLDESEKKARQPVEYKARKEAEVQTKEQALQRDTGEDSLRKRAEEDEKRSTAERVEHETRERDRCAAEAKSAEEKAKCDAADRARREEEERARLVEDASRVRQEAEDKARLMAEEAAKKDVKEKEKQRLEEEARREAEELERKEVAKKDAEEKEMQRLEAEKAMKDTEEKEKKRLEEEKARREAQDLESRNAREKEAREAEERARKETEEGEKRAAAEKARLEEEARAAAVSPEEAARAERLRQQAEEARRIATGRRRPTPAQQSGDEDDMEVETLDAGPPTPARPSRGDSRAPSTSEREAIGARSAAPPQHAGLDKAAKEMAAGVSVFETEETVEPFIAEDDTEETGAKPAATVASGEGPETVRNFDDSDSSEQSEVDLGAVPAPAVTDPRMANDNGRADPANDGRPAAGGILAGAGRSSSDEGSDSSEDENEPLPKRNVQDESSTGGISSNHAVTDPVVAVPAVDGSSRSGSEAGAAASLTASAAAGTSGATASAAATIGSTPAETGTDDVALQHKEVPTHGTLEPASSEVLGSLEDETDSEEAEEAEELSDAGAGVGLRRVDLLSPERAYQPLAAAPDVRAHFAHGAAALRDSRAAQRAEVGRYLKETVSAAPRARRLDDAEFRRRLARVEGDLLGAVTQVG